MSKVVAVDAKSFDQEVLKATEPVLLDVWAAWCGPCRMIAPVLEEVAAENAGKLKVAKLNSDENMALAQQLQIMSLPTLVLFKQGQEVTRFMGAMPKAMIMQRLSAFL